MKDSDRSVLESLNQLVNLIDKDLTIVYSNKSRSSHLKPTSGSIVGEKCYKVNHGVDKPCFNYGITCPVISTFREKRRAFAIHKHYMENEVIIEEIISTPSADNGYVIQELHNLNSLLGIRHGILPICSFCRRVRDKAGVWHSIEGYFQRQTGVEFSHSVCQACKTKHYPNIQ